MRRFALMVVAFSIGFVIASYCENGAPPSKEVETPLVLPGSADAAALTASAEVEQTSWAN